MARHTAIALCVLSAMTASAFGQTAPGRRWLAGDHHVHSIYSAQYRNDPQHSEQIPEPIIGGDSAHTIAQNAQMARRFGLDWMVSTDHGGPHHSALNHAQAWPDVAAARRACPDLLLFYGMEFDVPGGEHASLVMPFTPAERDTMREIEARFGKREAFPADPARNTKHRMIEALAFMAGLPDPPVLIANHPSRTATGPGAWGLHSPEEFRQWHHTAPQVAIGMEGAPGHQAARPAAGLDAAHGARGLYGGYPTLGGFDQMVATLGGGWDTLLGQGLRWTITATSDSHGHWREGGADFWPGEYAKTWVFAQPDHADILDGLRKGRVFAATGGLIEQLEFSLAPARDPGRAFAMGDTAVMRRGEAAIVTIKFRPASQANAGGALPQVDHIDLITGTAKASGKINARVAKRFYARDWRPENGLQVIRYKFKPDAGIRYLRLRGTNTNAREPQPDQPGEDPWQDLWFYGNPIYIQ